MLLLMCVLILVPGGIVVTAACPKLARRDPMLWMLSSAVLTIAIAGLAITGCMLLQRGIRIFVFLEIAATVALAAVAVMARRRHAGASAASDQSAEHRRSPSASAHGWPNPGRWDRLLEVLVVTIPAWLVRDIGVTYVSDAPFHSGLIERLARLPSLTPGTLGIFPDASVHPAYVIPAWHAVLAAGARLADVRGITVLTETTPIAVALAIAGSVILVRSVLPAVPLAGAIGGLGLVLSAVATTGPSYSWVRVATYPGSIAQDVALPLLLACALVLLRRPPGAAGAALRCVMVVATGVLVVLHANYILQLGMVAVGLVAGLLVLGLTRVESGRLLRVAAPSLLTAMAGLALLVPYLARLREFGRGSSEAVVDRVFDQWSGVLVRGDFGYRVAFDYLPSLGGPALLGLVGCGLLPLLRCRLGIDRFGRALGWGIPMVVAVIWYLPPLFATLAGAGSVPALVRAYRVLPIPLGLTLLAIACAALVLQGVQRRHVPALSAAAGVIALACWAVFGLPNHLSGRDKAEMPADVLESWVGVLLLLEFIVVGALTIALRQRASGSARGTGRGAPTAIAPSLQVSSLALASIAVLTAVSTASRADETRSEHREEQQRARTVLKNGDPGFDEPYISAFGGVQAGAVLLARPEVSYRIQGIAPVYTLAINKRGLASTNERSNEDRFEEVDAFFGAEATVAERRRFLDDRRPDVIVIPQHEGRIVALLKQRGAREVLKVRGLVVYCTMRCAIRDTSGE